MALGPKQMSEAVLRNLKSKTGKDVHQWINLLKKEDLKEKKAVITFLKSVQGLGHFQATAVFNEMSGSNIYKNEQAFVPALFSTPTLKKNYDQIAKKIQSLGKDIRIQPCKTYIPFYRKNQFAIVKPFRQDKILLGLNLPNDFAHPRFESGKSGGSVRINFKSILNDAKDFDQEIMKIIKMAYLNN